MKLFNLSGGGFAVDNPLVAFVRQSGSDVTGNGSYGKPFATIQAAYDADFRCFDLGFGVYQPLNLTGDSELYFRGVTGASSGLGSQCGVTIYAEGYNFTAWDTGIASVYISFQTYHYTRTWDGVAPAGNAKVYGGWIGSASVQGRDAIPGGWGNSQDNGQDAGRLDLYGPMYIGFSVNASGGRGADVDRDYGPAGNGGNAGQIYIWPGVTALPSATDIAAVGGVAGVNSNIGGDGTVGSDGSVTLRGCDVGSIVPNVGGGGFSAIGAIYGDSFHAS